MQRVACFHRHVGARVITPVTNASERDAVGDEHATTPSQRGRTTSENLVMGLKYCGSVRRAAIRSHILNGSPRMRTSSYSERLPREMARMPMLLETENPRAKQQNADLSCFLA